MPFPLLKKNSIVMPDGVKRPDAESPARYLTVLLLRTGAAADEGGSVEDNVYVCHARSDDVLDAIEFAQNEVFDGDIADGARPDSIADYKVLAVLDGKVEVCAYGFQVKNIQSPVMKP